MSRSYYVSLDRSEVRLYTHTCSAVSSSSTVARSNCPTSSPVLLPRESSSFSPSLSCGMESWDVWWVWSPGVGGAPSTPGGVCVAAVLSERDSWEVISVRLDAPSEAIYAAK